MPNLLNLGCSPWSQPMQKSVNPLRGEPPTGEPCAGESHARFGGGRDQATGSSYPYPSKTGMTFLKGIYFTNQLGDESKIIKGHESLIPIDLKPAAIEYVI